MTILISKLIIRLMVFETVNLNFVISIIKIIGVVYLAKKLTAGVLQGAQYTENMKVEWQGDEFEIEIKALNNKQASEVEALMQKGIKVKGKPGIGGKMERIMDFDTTENTYGRYASDVKAVALGTVDDSLTEKVVENEFPTKLVKEIAQRIKEITGIGGESDVDEFNEGLDNPSNSD